MKARILSLIAVMMMASSVSLFAQDADTRTQNFFDTHKDADPINTGRALTSTVKKTEEHYVESSLPPRYIPREQQKPSKEEQGLRELKTEGRESTRKTVNEKRTRERTFGAPQKPISFTEAEKIWSQTDEGKRINARLKQLEQDRQKSETKSTLPPRKY